MGQVTRRYVDCVSALGVLAAKSAHGVTGVATFILLADIRNQRLWTLHFDLEGGDQRVFCVNDNMSRFLLNFKTGRKLHLRARQLSRLGRHPLRRAGERQLPHLKPIVVGGFPPSLNAPIWPNENTMTNIVPSPFQAGSQELIAKLIRAGYLQPTQSHDAAVVASAVARLKKYLRGARDDTGPAHAA